MAEFRRCGPTLAKSYHVEANVCRCLHATDQIGPNLVRIWAEFGPRMEDPGARNERAPLFGPMCRTPIGPKGNSVRQMPQTMASHEHRMNVENLLCILGLLRSTGQSRYKIGRSRPKLVGSGRFRATSKRNRHFDRLRLGVCQMRPGVSQIRFLPELAQRGRKNMFGVRVCL